MKRGGKILIGFLFVLGLFLAINAVTTSSQTKEAETTVDGGQILELSSGDLQVTDSGEADGQTIVLLHGYANSLHWFDKLEPLLADEHRVIRIDLLGFGGSEKPEGGYSIVEQSQTVAEALSELDVEGALVVGNSMGGVIATSLAEQASQLVDRVALLDIAPDTDGFGRDTSVLRKASYVPVIGEAMWRATPDFVIEGGFEDAFSEGYDVDSSFDEEDRVVDDFRAMTYTSYDTASKEIGDYLDELPLDERFRQTPIPLLVVFGAEDQIFDAEESIEGYSDVPGVQTELLKDVGHAPQVEDPEAVAKLLDGFSVEPVVERKRPKPPKKNRKPGSDPSNEKKSK